MTKIYHAQDLLALSQSLPQSSLSDFLREMSSHAEQITKTIDIARDLPSLRLYKAIVRKNGNENPATAEVLWWASDEEMAREHIARMHPESDIDLEIAPLQDTWSLVANEMRLKAEDLHSSSGHNPISCALSTAADYISRCAREISEAWEAEQDDCEILDRCAHA